MLHGRWLRTIERHQKRELPVGQVQRAQGIIEEAGKMARRPLCVQAQAAIPHYQGGLEREGVQL